MGGQRIIVDHKHVMRQHKAFACMVIALLLVVLAVWFVQIRLMVRTVDFSRVRQEMQDTQASLEGALDSSAIDDVTNDASAAAAVVTNAIDEATVLVETNNDMRAAVGARAAEALQQDAVIDDEASEENDGTIEKQPSPVTQ